MDKFLIGLHDGVRWLVLLVSILALIKLIMGVIKKSTFQKLDAQLMKVYAILLSINVVLGLIMITIWTIRDGIVGVRFEHGTIMFGSLVVMMATAKKRRTGDDTTKFRNNLAALVVSLILVIIGIWRIGGWGS